MRKQQSQQNMFHDWSFLCGKQIMCQVVLVKLSQKYHHKQQITNFENQCRKFLFKNEARFDYGPHFPRFQRGVQPLSFFLAITLVLYRKRLEQNSMMGWGVNNNLVLMEL